MGSATSTTTDDQAVLDGVRKLKDDILAVLNDNGAIWLNGAVDMEWLPNPDGGAWISQYILHINAGFRTDRNLLVFYDKATRDRVDSWGISNDQED